MVYNIKEFQQNFLHYHGSAYFSGYDDGEIILFVDHKSEGKYDYGKDNYIEIHLYGHDDDEED